jgi:hypothetical protein
MLYKSYYQVISDVTVFSCCTLSGWICLVDHCCFQDVGRYKQPTRPSIMMIALLESPHVQSLSCDICCGHQGQCVI